MRHVSPRDIVPALRPGLTFHELPSGLGVERLKVTNGCTGKEFSLRGFECSLARMLDGRRTAREVIAAATELGLPLTLEALDAFLRKLAARSLLAAFPMPGAPSPFEPREVWSEQTRRLFRLALRQGRAGRLEQAVAALDCLLEQAPSTVEAHQLRHALKVQGRSREARLPFAAVFAQAERDWYRDAAGVPRLPARRAPLPRGLAGATAALLAGLLVFGGVGSSGKIAATLVPKGSMRVFTPSTGLTEELIELRAAQSRLEASRRRLETSVGAAAPLPLREAHAWAEAAVGWAEDDLQRSLTR